MYYDCHCVTMQVFWLKNNMVIDVRKEINYIISSEGSLIISQTSLHHTGNYTCGAVNPASRRLSDSASLTVFRELIFWKNTLYYIVVR